MKDAFIKIRKSIMDAPALMPLDFDKDFILYTFATDFFLCCYFDSETCRGHRDPHFIYEIYIQRV